jgi:hypothetical protein
MASGSAVPFVSTPGTSGRYFSTPHDPAQDLTGDWSLRILFALADWTPAAAVSIISNRLSADLDGYELYIDTNGDIGIGYGEGSTMRWQTIAPSPAFADGSAHLIEIAWDLSVPLVEYVVDGSLLGQDTPANTDAGTATGRPITIGGRSDGGEWAGDVYYAEIYDGIDVGRSLVAKFDPADAVNAA